MTDYLLDTNAVISAVNNPRLGGWLLAPHVLTRVSIVSEVELRFGVAAAPGDPRRIADLAYLTSRWKPIPVDADVAASFTTVSATVLAAGQQPRRRMNDLMIAATALTRGLTLVTDDQSLTRALKGLVTTTSLIDGTTS